MINRCNDNEKHIKVAHSKYVKLPRTAKIVFVFFVDLSLCISTVWMAFYLRLGEVINFSGSEGWRPLYAVYGALLIAIPIFVVSGFYRAIFRHSGWRALTKIVMALMLYGFIYLTVFMIVGVDGVPRTIGIIQPILLLLGVGASRVIARFWLIEAYATLFRSSAKARVLIYGAGIAGRQLASGLSNSSDMQVVGFLDDSVHLHGRLMNGVLVYSPDDLVSLVKRLRVGGVLLAMPSLNRNLRNTILKRMLGIPVFVRTLPSLTDLVQGKVSVSDITDLDLDDLLAREAHSPDQLLLSKSIDNKTVMVTGAGGSIGSELSRQIAGLNPKKILLCEQSEYALYTLHQELLTKHPNFSEKFVPLLASVRDFRRMTEIMTAWLPDTVYHAAAYKHVPLVEINPVEGVFNNALGTLATTLAALNAGVSDFVLISTDKAVRPTNMMGASKRLAELILQAIAHESDVGNVRRKTIFSMVRFGNVLGSSGSVVPKFREQIRNGGPITLTHPDITRYFMTISEAAQLVLQAGAMAQGGDVFVLDMHEPIKIKELAIRMIKLSGLTVCDQDNPSGDIEIKVTGLRDGEKLYEELLIGNNPETTSHSGIMKACEEFYTWAHLKPKLGELEQALLENDIKLVRSLMQGLVTGYVPHEKIVDLVFSAEAT